MSYIIEIIFYTLYFRSLNYLKQFLLKFEIHRVEEVGRAVCLYPINVKTAEPIGPTFFVGHLGTPGKVYEKSKFQIFVSIKIQ